jgi:hypothetical protein
MGQIDSFFQQFNRIISTPLQCLWASLWSHPLPLPRVQDIYYAGSNND